MVAPDSRGTRQSIAASDQKLSRNAIFAQLKGDFGVSSILAVFPTSLGRTGFVMISRIRTGILAAAAAAFLSSQAVYAAPLAGSSQLDPLVSLSLLGSTTSQAAVCAGSTAAMAAATAAAQGAPGCVLPVTAPPPVTPVAEGVPAPVVAAPGAGIGTLPLLLGLAAIIGVAALLLSSGHNGHGNVTPVSPA